MSNRKIYFDEFHHKYTDDMGNAYTSVTTVIGNYYNHFESEKVAAACERIGRNPSHPKYLKYKGKSKEVILYEWGVIKDDACENGSKKHDFLETAIKKANGYKKYGDTIFINDRIYTVEDIRRHPDLGQIDLTTLIATGIAERYPKIYNDVVYLVNQGFKIYAEIGVYSYDHLISGLIDLMLVRGDQFIIFDWKTNKANIRFESGYYEKDIDNNLTDNFIPTRKYFKAPLHTLEDSVGNHYNMQISTYTVLAEMYGFRNLGNLLYQIRDVGEGKLEKIDVVPLNDYRAFANTMINHHKDNLQRKTQMRMFL